MAALSLEQQLADQQLAERERLARVEAKADRAISLLEQLLAQRQADPLTAIHAITGGTPAAGRNFISRNPGLRACGVRVGVRLLFKKAEVLAWLAQPSDVKRALNEKAQRPRLHAIGGAKLARPEGAA